MQLRKQVAVTTMSKAQPPNYRNHNNKLATDEFVRELGEGNHWAGEGLGAREIDL